MFREACVVRSEVWEVIANLEWVAFDTPMFSRLLDAGHVLELEPAFYKHLVGRSTVLVLYQQYPIP